MKSITTDNKVLVANSAGDLKETNKNFFNRCVQRLFGYSAAKVKAAFEKELQSGKSIEEIKNSLKARCPNTLEASKVFEKFIEKKTTKRDEAAIKTKHEAAIAALETFKTTFESTYSLSFGEQKIDHEAVKNTLNSMLEKADDLPNESIKSLVESLQLLHGKVKLEKGKKAWGSQKGLTLNKDSLEQINKTIDTIADKMQKADGKTGLKYTSTIEACKKLSADYEKLIKDYNKPKL
ncbi:MAG: hypothetical protein A2Y14_04410 [Verrucomicrobia bacterium GWF2_51_19]|nr:MAG: hypothetical protein A2Y14_04410 [Verrucomicrobia bacterium GWF2_51_19]HCJ11847.1 hypothetical protein [Opitutae bacterium]